MRFVQRPTSGAQAKEGVGVGIFQSNLRHHPINVLHNPFDDDPGRRRENEWRRLWGKRMLGVHRLLNRLSGTGLDLQP